MTTCCAGAAVRVCAPAGRAAAKTARAASRQASRTARTAPGRMVTETAYSERSVVHVDMTCFARGEVAEQGGRGRGRGGQQQAAGGLRVEQQGGECFSGSGVKRGVRGYPGHVGS